MRFFTFFILVVSMLSKSETRAAMPVAPVSSPQAKSITASGNSYNPVFSADGGSLVFLSQANNLVTNDDLGLNLDVFVRDLNSQVTILVSAASGGKGGANRDALEPSISADGRYVAFQSTASNLVANDTNGFSDIFVRDTLKGTTHLASVGFGADGSGNGKSESPLLSVDGRWVVFESSATNLVPGSFDTNYTQIYIRDMVSNTTHLVSANWLGTGPANAAADSHAISAQGDVIAFISAATNLAVGLEDGCQQVYVRDMKTASTTCISSNIGSFYAGNTNSYRCSGPVLSDSGQMLAFKVIRADSNQASVFLFDRATENLTCIASNSTENSKLGLSSNGCILVFESDNQIRMWDQNEKTNRIVSLSVDNQAAMGGKSITPTISADGRTVVFLSSATNLTFNAANAGGAYLLYVRDLGNGAARLLNVGDTNRAFSLSSEFTLPAVSADGGMVAFESMDDGIVSNDLNRASDIFLYHRENGGVQLVSSVAQDRETRSGIGNCYLNFNCLSADGRFALIISTDNNMDASDTNSWRDAYWCDLITGKTKRLPVLTNLLSPEGGSIYNPFVSANGKKAVFFRTDWASYYSSEGYLYDIDSNELKLFNLDDAGNVIRNVSRCPENYSYPTAGLSPDGKLLAFTSTNSQCVKGMTNSTKRHVFLRDLDAGTNMLVSHRYDNPYAGVNGDTFGTVFSPDGRWLLFYSMQAREICGSGGTLGLFALDLVSKKVRIISNFDPSYHKYNVINGVFSADSRFVYYHAPFNLYRHDLSATNTGTSLITTNLARGPSFPDYGGASYSSGSPAYPSVSSNGLLVVFKSYDDSGKYISDIRVKDLETGKLELISADVTGFSGGNGNSTYPQISPDGRFVVFSSQASNLVLNDNNGFCDVFLRDRLLGVTYLLSANSKTGASGNRPSSDPMMSVDGSTIVFASWASDLIEGDYNDKRDVFVVKLSQGDSDHDGLDDGWEMAFFGDLIRDGSDDFDGDGLGDRDESRTGSDPTNRGSYFQALVMRRPGDTYATLMWKAIPGKQYEVQYKRQIQDAEWQTSNAPITISGNIARASNELELMGESRFYRIAIK